MVLLFKTNLTNESDVSRVQMILSRFANVKQVSVDLEDCDKVLRVVGVEPVLAQIESLLSSLGVSYSELDD